ncbi:MAG: hypothetical protein ACXVX6_15080 [Mycobacterium sp.]
MWSHIKQQRLDRISAELIPLVETKSLSDSQVRRMKALTDEGEALVAEKETCQKAKSMMSYASPAESGRENTNPGDADNSVAFGNSPV